MRTRSEARVGVAAVALALIALGCAAPAGERVELSFEPRGAALARIRAAALSPPRRLVFDVVDERAHPLSIGRTDHDIAADGVENWVHHGFLTLEPFGVLLMPAPSAETDGELSVSIAKVTCLARAMVLRGTVVLEVTLEAPGESFKKTYRGGATVKSGILTGRPLSFSEGKVRAVLNEALTDALAQVVADIGGQASRPRT